MYYLPYPYVAFTISDRCIIASPLLLKAPWSLKYRHYFSSSVFALVKNELKLTHSPCICRWFGNLALCQTAAKQTPRQKLMHSRWRRQMEAFPRYWPFERGIHRSPVNSPHKGQWCGVLMFSLIFLSLNKRLSKQSRRRWFETPLRPLWRHSNVIWRLTWWLHNRETTMQKRIKSANVAKFMKCQSSEVPKFGHHDLCENTILTRSPFKCIYQGDFVKNTPLSSWTVSEKVANLGQQWLVAWRRQAIVWTNVKK